MRRDHPIHRAWVIHQASQSAAIEYRRQMATLDAYCNPTPEARAAAQRVRETLAEKRRERKESEK